MWEGEAMEAAVVQAAAKKCANSLGQWRATSIEERFRIVRNYAQHLQDHQDEISELIVREIGKLPWDAAGEVRAAVAKAELSIQAYQQRRSEHAVDRGSEINRVVRFQPLGVTLVLGPFNFPLHLPGGQIIPALLAGNTILFKPSDQATAVGIWMAEAWKKAGLPEGVLEVVVGEVATAVAAIDCPEIAGVFLTGSRSAGHAIHRQLAGRPHVLLALELGGNNPIVVMDDVAADDAAAIVSFSAFISAGQRCTCSRRVIFVGDQVEPQLEALQKAVGQLRIGIPTDEPAVQIGPLISSTAAEGLERTYERLLEIGCQPLVPFSVDPRRSNLVAPAIVDARGLNDEGLQELADMEWFGPLLVVQQASDFEQGLEFAADTNYGLAASLLGGTSEMFSQFVDRVGAGVVNWNGPTTGAAGALPFGGLGDSGNHRPAGFYAIDFCSDPVASLERSEIAPANPWDIAK